MTDRSSPLTVLIVDDHELVRLGVRHVLGERARFVEASSLRQALEAVAASSFDLILLDLSLGDEFSLTALPRLREAAPNARIVVLTSLAEDLYAERALRAGADGYVMKSALGNNLLQAVDTVLAGQVYVSAELGSAMLRRMTGRPGGDSRPELSARETEVLRLIASGKSTREIAEALNRSVKTIETHKQALKTKLGADSPSKLVRLAVSWFGETA
ncbi:MAG: response regulator transcription factor [Burkholderiales bacterium]|nr:response regulator transcription factor [Burkholderiales bacterium]MDE2396002.1 response regulator transcription factor [Burkholderiales bacterium]MDE2457231.1 response regulator transcription factor [Burkholderiales bacterium]